MATVKVRWLQKVNGRVPGLVEEIEHTEYVDALASQRRLVILPQPGTVINGLVGGFDPKPTAVVAGTTVSFDPPVDTFVPPAEPVTTEAESLTEAEIAWAGVAEVEEVPAPKPRAPRKPKVVEEPAEGDSV